MSKHYLKREGVKTPLSVPVLLIMGSILILQAIVGWVKANYEYYEAPTGAYTMMEYMVPVIDSTPYINYEYIYPDDDIKWLSVFLSLDGEVKSRALARHAVALRPHRATHHLTQPLADGQTQPGAAVAAGG